jgi:hypothetical protein
MHVKRVETALFCKHLRHVWLILCGSGGRSIAEDTVNKHKAPLSIKSLMDLPLIQGARFTAAYAYAQNA